ncbi:MAG: ferritin-like domain-containing protein [Candidatus Binataceae bacterium]
MAAIGLNAIVRRKGVLEKSQPEKLIVIMNFYRDAELRGARLLLNLHHHLRDADSQFKLTRHLADETRHAWLWTKRIVEIGGLPASVANGYQHRLGLRIGVPKDTLELLALTLVAENRALDRYRAHAARRDVDSGTLAVLKAVSGDEQWHLAWIREKLREIAANCGDKDRGIQVLDRYAAIEREVYASFEAEEAELMSR